MTPGIERPMLKADELSRFIRDVPDFPKPGIVFKDITPLLQNTEAFQSAVYHLSQPHEARKIDQVIGIESRGFIFGAPVACRLGAGFIPVRKKGKLPWQTEQISYELEYGQDTLEMHRDALFPGANVLIVDDVLATGGTAYAVAQLVEKCGAKIVGIHFVLELGFLKGRSRLSHYDISSILLYS